MGLSEAPVRRCRREGCWKGGGRKGNCNPAKTGVISLNAKSPLTEAPSLLLWVEADSLSSFQVLLPSPPSKSSFQVLLLGQATRWVIKIEERESGLPPQGRILAQVPRLCKTQPSFFFPVITAHSTSSFANSYASKASSLRTFS
jgi:hypothetical protein